MNVLKIHSSHTIHKYQRCLCNAVEHFCGLNFISIRNELKEISNEILLNFIRCGNTF